MSSSFHALCHRVNEAAKAKPKSASLKVAASYARAGMGMNDTEALRVQALYILSNLAYWRGAEAAEVRMKLEEFTK